MIFLAGLLNRSSLSFVLVSIVRLFSILAILFLFASEIYLIVVNIQGFHNASHEHTNDSGSHSQPLESKLQNATNQNVDKLLSNTPTTISGYIDGTNIPTTFGGVLFFVLGQLFNIIILILCLLSELSFPPIPNFFQTFFPPLGQSFGVGILGSLQIYVSCTLLSHHLNMTVRASSWLLFVIGIINVMFGIIFGRRIRSKRSLLDASTAYVKKTAHVDDIETGFNFAQSGFRKGRKVFKNVRRSMIGKPQVIDDKHVDGSEMASATRPLQISKPIIDYIQHRRAAAENPNHPEPDFSAPLPTEPSPIYSTHKTVDLPQASFKRTP